MTGLWLVSYLALWILFLVVAVLLISVLYQLGIIYSKIEKRLPPPTKLVAGATLPNAELQTSDGSKVAISKFHGDTTAFVIISPGCSGCLHVLKAIASGDGMMQLPVQQMVVVSLSDLAVTLEMFREAGLSKDYPLLLDTKNVLLEAWGIHTTPVIVEVDTELKISKQRAIA